MSCDCNISTTTQPVSVSAPAAATVLSQWLPRTSSAIRVKYNTDFAKVLPKVAAGSGSGVDLEELAAACDALKSQLMMWSTTTSNGLPLELQVSDVPVGTICSTWKNIH